MSLPKANVSGGRTAVRASQGWIARILAAPANGPKYLAIAGALAKAIAAGEISAGDRLPPQRLLARDLGVDLTTITRAYAQVRAMGLLDGETGRGTFVRAGGSPDGPIIDLSMNLPPPPRDVSLRDLVTRGIADVLRDGDPTALMSYRSGMGSRRDRMAAAAWLAPRLDEVALERVFLAPGAQSAIAALLPLVVKVGEIILAEPLTYPGIIAAARLYGAREAPMICDEVGPIPEALVEICKKLRPRAIYIIPTLQNPTARTLSEGRRRALIEAARKFDLQIIEDDAYGAFAPQMAPLARLAPERVYFISTLSKCLSPGLRSAFVVTPHGGDYERTAYALRAVGLMPTPVLSDMATRWLEDGTAQRLFKAVKAESAARMRMARAILPARVQGADAGFHLWLTLPERWTLKDYLAAAHTQGVVMVGAEAFAVAPGEGAGVRISLGAVADRAQLAKGLKALVKLESN